MMEKPVAVIGFYHGFFLGWGPTLKRNQTIDFYFYTDCNHTLYNGQKQKRKPISKPDSLLVIKQGTDQAHLQGNPMKPCESRSLRGPLHYMVVPDDDNCISPDFDILHSNLKQLLYRPLNNGFAVFSTLKEIPSDHYNLFEILLSNRNRYKKMGGRYEKNSSKDADSLEETFLLKTTNTFIETQKKGTPIDELVSLVSKLLTPTP